MSSTIVVKPITAPGIRARKGKTPVTMLTAYDYPTARILEDAGIDLLLVGDSVATVLYGEPNTLSVTLEDMIRHTRAVARGASRSLVIADMPFMSYQVSRKQAVENAGRLVKEAQAQGVKLEGGSEMAKTIAAIVKAGIPVVAHIGLTPQTINAMGSYRMHGKTDSERKYLLKSAAAVAEAGAFCVVLECVEAELAREITEKISIPTIGIGSGPHCDGQVLVTQDLVGLTLGHVPRFVSPLADLKTALQQAVQGFIARTQREPVPASPEAIQTASRPIAALTDRSPQLPPVSEKL